MIHFLDQLDKKIFIYINQNWASKFLDLPMIALSSTWFFVPLYVWGIFRLIQNWKRKSWIPILLLFLAFGLADSISSRIFKDGVKRLRPCFNNELKETVRLPDGMPGGKYGFISSHSANAFAVYPLLMLMVFAAKPSPEKKKIHDQIPQKTNFLSWKYLNSTQRNGYLIMLFMAALVAYSRIYLGRHYLGDVLGGAILGVFIGMVIWKWYLRNFSKWMIIE
jgi:undecaprenyl-diphosphatase